MRVLITCWPFEGHLFPQLAAGRALADRGHDVAVYSGVAAEERVTEAGLAFHPFRALESAHFRRVQASEAAIGARGQSVRVQRQAFGEWLVESIPQQVADLRAIAAGRRPDVVLTDLSMWGPMLVFGPAEGVPVVGSSTFLGPMIPGPQAPPWGFGLAPAHGPAGRARDAVLDGLIGVAARGLRRRVDELRADEGLPALGMSVNAFTGTLPLYLVPSLRELDFDRTDLPETVHYVGPSCWFPTAAAPESDWLASVPTDLPWVHVTEGTSHYQDPFVLRAAARGLAGEPVRVIGTTGGNREVADLGFGSLAPNVHLTRWLSHADLLPRCAAVVTTGGPATVLAALGSGVPLVVVPTTWDKPDNARRVVERGVGLSLGPRRCTPARLRAAVTEVLTDPAYRRNAAEVAGTLAAAPGPARSAELVEQLISDPSPRARATAGPTPSGAA